LAWEFSVLEIETTNWEPDLHKYANGQNPNQHCAEGSALIASTIHRANGKSSHTYKQNEGEMKCCKGLQTSANACKVHGQMGQRLYSLLTGNLVSKSGGSKPLLNSNIIYTGA
jgi:hypothetical protein